ncbi:response regulator transcription factor [Paenibacillus sp. GYB003]|uniref:response regulator transcription factor n=1 Tax=Paenibacillus sp. GYB003 TaxID=2994392 RepID=UPI002F96452B
MWSILIVEDEAYVRKYLRKNVGWNESGFEVIGEASNGRAALEFMKTNQPDLVLCDIAMPIMNGIDLLKEAKEAGLQSVFVMLTCMNEFEYARAALKNGAFDYMLKLSMDASILRDALRKVDEELRRRAKQASLQRLFDYQPLYEKVWARLTDASRDGAAEPFEHPGVEMMPHVWVCSVLNGKAPFSADDLMSMRLIPPDNHAVIHLFPGLGQTTVFYWSGKEIQVNPLHGKETPFPMAACSPVPGSRWVEAWRSALRKLDEAWYSGLKALQFSHIGERMDRHYPTVSWKAERQWVRYVERAQTNECVAWLHDLWNRMERDGFPMPAVKYTANRFDQLLHRISDYPVRESDNLLDCAHHRELLDMLLSRLRRGIGNGPKARELLTDHDEINKVLEFVHEHYDQNISLKTMARHAALEEHYLSSLFKKKTGSNFIDYLHAVRIERAKQLLDGSELTVSEVGRRVGFPNDNYFIKIFKRFVNMTPKMYRGSKEDETP